MVNLNEFLSQETGFYSMPDSVKIMHRAYITRNLEQGFLKHQVIIRLLVSFSKLISTDVQITLTACVKEKKKTAIVDTNLIAATKSSRTLLNYYPRRCFQNF